MAQEQGTGTRRQFLSRAALGATLAPEMRAQSARKRFSVAIAASSAEVLDFLSWRLWDPFVLQAGIPQVAGRGGNAPVDLLILGQYQSGRGIEVAMERAGGVIAVQPAELKAPLAAAVASRMGVRFRKWDYKTPAFSVATGHPLLQPLACTTGRSFLPHLPFAWHMEIEPVKAEVVTRFTSGAPDIVINGRSALIASNLVFEVLQYHRHPDTLQFNGDLSLVLANLTLAAIGAQPVDVPAPKLYLDWRDHFYGYAFGREFIFELLALKGESVGGALRELVEYEAAHSDELIAAAAGCLLRDDVPGMQALYRDAAEGLLRCRLALTKVQPYFIRGWHGGLLSDRMVDGEIIGYAEWGWPSRTMKWTEARLAVSERLGYKQINQVGGATWDQIADRGLTDLDRWKRASAAGLIESVKGMYSDAYMEVIGPESNIRQFEYGLRAFRRMSQGVRTFMVATDDFAFHPQLPQILKSFGFEFAVLRPGGPGRFKGVDCAQLLWKGLDGTCIQAVPNYATVPQTLIAGNGGIARMPQFLLAAEKAGLPTAIGGGAVDDTLYMHGEREYESLNSVVPVQAIPATWPEYCQRAPIRPEPVFFTADDMLGYPCFWSGYGSINAECRDDRRLERLLVAAEKFSTLAAQKGRPYPTAALDRAWKYLLSSQDHFSYGCGGPDNPEGYNVGGLQEGGMRGYAGPRIPITMEDTDVRWKKYAGEAGREALEGALAHLCRVEAEGRTAAGGACLLVYNPLNWSRKGTAQAWVRAPSGAPQLVAFDGEQETGAAVLERRGEEALVEFHAQVPSLGFRAYTIRAGNTPAAPAAKRLENRYFRVEVSPETGAVTSLFDKARGKELLRPGEVTRIECSEPRIDTRTARAQVKLDRADAVASRMHIQGQLAKCSYTLLLTLAHESPWLEVGMEIDYGKGAIFGFKMKPETLLRAVFPLRPGSRWINLPFGVYQTAVANPVMLDFCDAHDGSSGVAILIDSMPGLHLADDNVEVLVSDGFPPLRGVHPYRFAIYPHAGDWRAGNVLRNAHEFQEKLPALALPESVSLPFERSYLEAADGVVLSALTLKGGKMHARFYDTTGAASRIETRWRIPWKDASAVRLDDQAEGDLPVDGAHIRFDLPAWRILTIAGRSAEGGQA